MPALEQRLQILRDAKPDTWLALADDESIVVGRGATYEEAVKQALQNGTEDPIMLKTPVDWNPRVF